MLIHHGPNLDHWFNQCLWRQDIPQPQGWIENLAHRARVDDTTHIIEALQTWEWGTGITKFRVVVVLENVSVAGARKIDQSRSPRETHRHSKRKLMRRSYIDDFRRALFRWSRDRDSFPVNRSWNDGRAREAQGSAGLVKSRILDPRNLTPIYEGHRADHHCLLGSSGDDDLVWMTARTSVITQIRCECLAQIGVATASWVLWDMC